MTTATFLWPSLVTTLTLVLYQVLAINVARARRKYKVPVPQMSGDPDFERVMRVHQNTLEQLIMFLPALWLFSLWVSPIWGAALGGAWLIGRVLYAWGYYQAAEKRLLGFGINSLTTIILLLGALFKTIWLLLPTNP